jgi:SAM-dependent methyltransferase
MSSPLTAERWNTEYENGKYKEDAPVAFVNTIAEELGEEGKDLLGLYVGCGNGRNYIPLVQMGFNIYGIDPSSAGISQLVHKYPHAATKVKIQSIEDITQLRRLDYIVAIQVFQHGNRQVAHEYFHHARRLLRKPELGKPRPRLFARVNSSSTKVAHSHVVDEHDADGSFTVRYVGDHKKDMQIHFYSQEELKKLAAENDFEFIVPPYEVLETRQDGGGTWSQWEMILAKT